MQTFSEMDKVKGYLNYDMIGRNKDESKPMHVVYFYTEAHPVFGDWLKNDIKKYGLNLTPDYRPWDKPVGGVITLRSLFWIFRSSGTIRMVILTIICQATMWKR